MAALQPTYLLLVYPNPLWEQPVDARLLAMAA
jgi:hypothetical protein